MTKEAGGVGATHACIELLELLREHAEHLAVSRSSMVPIRAGKHQHCTDMIDHLACSGPLAPSVARFCKQTGAVRTLPCPSD